MIGRDRDPRSLFELKNNIQIRKRRLHHQNRRSVFLILQGRSYRPGRIRGIHLISSPVTKFRSRSKSATERPVIRGRILDGIRPNARSRISGAVKRPANGFDLPHGHSRRPQQSPLRLQHAKPRSDPRYGVSAPGRSSAHEGSRNVRGP